MTDRADEAENLLANLWRYDYVYREEDADGEKLDGRPAEDRLRAAVTAYRLGGAE